MRPTDRTIARFPSACVAPRCRDVIAQPWKKTACRKFGAPVRAARRGTSLAGQCCKSRWCSISPYTWTGCWKSIPPKKGEGAAGIVLDSLRRVAAARLIFRSRPFHPQPLHRWRHDRQQLLRSALAAGRQDRRQRRRTEHRLYDGTRMTAGATSDRQLAPSLRGRTPGRNLREAPRLAR